MTRARGVLIALSLACAACGNVSSDGGPAESATSQPVTTATTEDDVEPEPTTTPPTAASPEPAATEPVATAAPTTEPAPTPTATTVPPGLSASDIRTAIEAGLISASGTSVLVDRMAELDVVGLAVAIVRDGDVLTSFGAGVTPDGAPMTPATIAQVASVSKPVAAIGAASMAADAALDWNADITELLTSYALPAGEQTPAEPVTIERLLSHTGGTNVDGFLGYPTSEAAPDLPTLLAGGGDTEAVAVVATPGSAFSYSGGGYELVEQTMLDTAGASTFDELIGERVFDVVGMPDSFYALELTEDQRSRVSVGSINGAGFDQEWQRHPENAAAGLWTTADDLAALLVAFNASLAGTDESLLPREWALKMVEPAVAVDIPAANIGAMGHGFFLDALDGPQVYRHNGRNLGYTSEVAGSTDGKFAVVVVTNSFPGGTDLAREIIATTIDTMDWTT